MGTFIYGAIGAAWGWWQANVLPSFVNFAAEVHCVLILGLWVANMLIGWADDGIRHSTWRFWFWPRVYSQAKVQDGCKTGAFYASILGICYCLQISRVGSLEAFSGVLFFLMASGIIRNLIKNLARIQGGREGREYAESLEEKIGRHIDAGFAEAKINRETIAEKAQADRAEIIEIVSEQRPQGETLMPRIEIPCPYACQYDDTHKDPYTDLLEGPGACNVTCVGMCLSKFGLADKVPGPEALVSDRLLRFCDEHGQDRHSLEVLRNLSVMFGLKDDASYQHSFEEIKHHLLGGNPVIVQGMFTPSGHVIVVLGFDTDEGTWLCNDPAGDHTAPNGYRQPGWRSGNHVWYPSSWFRPAAAPDGKVWAHLVSKA
jgi:hypothetical protein